MHVYSLHVRFKVCSSSCFVAIYCMFTGTVLIWSSKFVFIGCIAKVTWSSHDGWEMAIAAKQLIFRISEVTYVWIMAFSPLCRFAPWLVRPLARSPPGLFAPWLIRPSPRWIYRWFIIEACVSIYRKATNKCSIMSLINSYGTLINVLTNWIISDHSSQSQ